MQLAALRQFVSQSTCTIVMVSVILRVGVKSDMTGLPPDLGLSSLVLGCGRDDPQAMPRLLGQN